MTNNIKLQMLVLAASLSATTFHASAGEIYKCSEQGRTIYQDMPCKSGPSTSRQDIKSSKVVDTKSMSLASIYQQMQSLSAESRSLDAGHSRDIEKLKQRLAGSTDAQLNRSEIERVHGKWLPRIQDVNRRMDELSTELRRRCPSGASLNAANQTCNK